MEWLIVVLCFIFASTTLLMFVLYTKKSVAEKEQSEKNKYYETSAQDLKNRILTVESESKDRLSERQQKIETLQAENLKLSNRVHALEESEENRRRLHDDKISQLNQVLEHQNKQREKEEKFQLEKERQRQEELKKTWVTHEKNVEERFDILCQRHGLQSVRGEDFPFRGRPDNAVLICDDYVIFDSKSPAGESLEAFPQYVRTQAEALKKYIKFERVKKEAFLVVPHNTLSIITEKTMSFGDYKVFVISEESLEPILMQLKRIEDYEFTESLSPENREALVSVVGKMAHGMKRRIQVDQFFSKEFLSILSGLERLPGDLVEQVSKVEQALKVNPPNENRKKSIDSEELFKEQERLSNKAESL
jgi:hypothetical protein